MARTGLMMCLERREASTADRATASTRMMRMGWTMDRSREGRLRCSLDTRSTVPSASRWAKYRVR